MLFDLTDAWKQSLVNSFHIAGLRSAVLYSTMAVSNLKLSFPIDQSEVIVPQLLFSRYGQYLGFIFGFNINSSFLFLGLQLFAFFLAVISNSVAKPFVFGFYPRPFRFTVFKRVTPAPTTVLVCATRNVSGYFAPQQRP